METAKLDPVVAERISQLTEGGRLAIILCANAFRFGGNWGFLRRSKPEFREILEVLKEERPNVRAIPVKNGAIIFANENFLAHNVNYVYPNAINEDFVTLAMRRREEERANFMKFLKSALSGDKYKKKGYYEITLGVFCVNEKTNLIRLNGVDYPAYKLTLIEVLDIASRLNRKVYALAVKEDKTEVFDLIQNLAMNSWGLAALYRGLEIAESDTGAFLTLRIV